MLERRTRLARKHMGGAKCVATLATQGQTRGAARHNPGNVFILHRAPCTSATPSRKRRIRNPSLPHERAHFRPSLIPLSRLTTTIPAPSLLRHVSDPLTPALAHIIEGLLGRRALIREGARVLFRCGRKRYGIPTNSLPVFHPPRPRRAGVTAVGARLIWCPGGATAPSG